ncbi:MAG: glycosyltransferase family 39 protein [Candidatus Limnocylindria bacterium]
MRGTDQPEEQTPAISAPLGVGVLRAVAWGAGTLAMALIALVATTDVVDLLARLVSQFPAPYGRLGIAFTAAYTIGGAGLLVAAWRLGGWPGVRSWLLPVGIVLVAVGVRYILAALVDAPLTGENRIIHQQALGVLDGGSCCFGQRPMGYPLVLAGVYGLLGSGFGAVETLNIACAAATTWLVFDIGRVAWDRRVGALAAMAFAIIPSQVLMTLPPLTEPLYTVLVAGTVRLVIATPSRPLVAAAMVGVAVAGAQYVRATAVSLLAPIVVLPLLVGAGLRRSMSGAAMTVAAFVVAVLPVISFNLEAHGDLSVSTSAYAGWSLFVGANQASAGRWNPDDAALFSAFPGESAWEKSEHAGGLALERIFDDPGGYLELQPRKFVIVWGDESYAAAYALAPAGEPVSREVRVGWLVSQLFYAPFLLLALIAMLSEWRRPRPAVLLIGMIVSLVVVTHLFVEAHSRYHTYLIPLLVVLAAGGVNALVRYLRGVWSAAAQARRAA